MVTYITESAKETQALGRRLATELRPGDVLLLTGDLGAGKTQLVKGIASVLGITEAITSPTFNLMLEYRGGDGELLRHFDLYRLESPEQLEDIDYFGLLEAGDAVSVVEWGDKFPEALPVCYRLVRFSILTQDMREIVVEDIGKPGESDG
ncbi:MAG: tRNA (adenosine(37)-N6)-threonylcarbamoyltransferase complex ATPase subunit type 1 TsaE [Coriobacteriales bacterium]|jgi:tRNA threonylcarbamoyladenosine biosynthesis protein TsaE|nr:tRNA (adenosine(37)-N6)-threonylcarbamoyltransferase complex ATPase subunit type 1 TsaE [Coriobacteriales bacterium]